MAADMTPLATLAPRPAFDLLSAGWVMLVTVFFELLPHLAQLLGAAVLLITLWEKPTVQALVARWRARKGKDNDASG